MLANLMATGKGVTIMDPKDPTSIQKGLQQQMLMSFMQGKK